MPLRPAIIPGLIYGDAPAAIDFLCAAFGFERHLVVPGEDGRDVLHAQLVFEGNMVMLSSSSAESRERFGMAARSETGGLVCGYVNVVLGDPDAHHARAVAAGASVINPPHDNDYGGRGYEVRDTEGNIWSFGSYDPWADAMPTEPTPFGDTGS